MHRFISGKQFAVDQTTSNPTPYYVVLGEGDTLLATGDFPWRPLSEPQWRSLDIPASAQHLLGGYEGHPCFAVKIDTLSMPPEPFHWVGLRQLMSAQRILDDEFGMVGAALQVLDWEQTYQFCSRCGSPVGEHSSDRAKVCGSCNIHFYPRISPCVITLVSRDDHCLLARHNRSPSNFYSTLAGFIEAGESVEQALHREVAEEVGVSVKNIQYFASQPWPYPGQLMLGYTAEYDSGEIEVDGVEIADARWFKFNELPPVPPTGSIAGRLIQRFVEQHQ
ncbi:NAD(+) diphosphatase [Aurantivibrio plasticivorans]